MSEESTMNKVLRSITLILLTLILLTGCLTGCAQSGPEVGKSAPEFALKNLDGQTISLKDLQGKAVLLNFWATWCGPCRGEMPFLEEIYQEWSDEKLVLLAVNIGESSSQASAFLESNNLSLPVLLDTRQTVAEQYNITAIPTTFFIDKDGIIQDKVVGSFQNRESIESYINRLIP
jgi:peroxiredoxin